tara:strand:- start:645 stop:839 length:195 start_codon:yes stop_codon:yes gene_type:complete
MHAISEESSRPNAATIHRPAVFADVSVSFSLTWIASDLFPTIAFTSPGFSITSAAKYKNSTGGQ